MRFRVETTLRALLQLERQVVTLRVCQSNLEQASASGELATAMEAIGGARQALDIMVAELARLRRLVVPIDGLGDAVGSSDELIVRVVRLLLVTQVSVLREASSRPGGPQRLPLAAQAWASRLGDVLLFIDKEVDRVTAMWTRFRDGSTQSNAQPSRVLYRAAIRSALVALTSLVEEPEIGCFLAQGAALAGWSEASRACEIIQALSCIETVAMPDRRLWSYRGDDAGGGEICGRTPTSSTT